MTGVLLAALLILQDGSVHPCERLELEVGQAACFSQCRAVEPVCPGDEKVKCDAVDVVHPGLVERIEVVRP